MLGLLMELGPCLVQEDGTLKKNPYGWNKKANIIFLDQPINTGFSYGKNSSENSLAAAADVYVFLQMFFQKFPKYQKLEFHIFGESYGGHYVPDIAAYIDEKNAVSSSSSINLASIGIGNGDTDPLIQYGYYAEMACNNTYEPILKKKECLKMQSEFPACRKKIKKCYASKKVKKCVKAEDYCEKVLMGPFSQTGLNPYDIRRKCGDNPLCYDLTATIEAFLRKESLREELGAANPKDFKACSGKVGKRFYKSGDQMYPLVEKIPQLLSSGIRVLIYAGDADFICNWLGNKAWTLNLDWEGRDGYNRVIDRLWTVDYQGEKGSIQVAGGEVRSAYNLTFLRIFSAGHMVPYDQPQIAQIMFNSWLDMSLS
ncbi:hypothetical protein DSO57_1003303 [Entomophthora muscae]|uniref:Uncharacterized protein n=1 Tax=Entomophthora muscae TaxID=34485 RepID=A0ACC2T847_9FUNG|nr:hypothetical protein DSO57_1003303 [Entomophthora muscae]